MTFHPVDEVQVDLDTATGYAEGWQSWSPVGSHPVTDTSQRPAQEWQHLMRFRPGVTGPDVGLRGEGLLVLDAGGGDIRVYGAPDPAHVVPSVRARVEGDTVVVTVDGPVGVIRAPDVPTAMARFADAVRTAAGAGSPRTAPTAWCSWYRYATGVTQHDVLEALEAIRRHDLPVDVVQTDDGWQADVGDWSELSGRFTSLVELARRIRGDGRRAGIWVAPFLATSGSRLVRDHPEWIVGAAGTNWGTDLVGLDLTHPGVRGYLASVFEQLRAAGFDYVKLDFLYAGALPGERHGAGTAVEAYRTGLELVRDALGPHAYLVGCGAPLLPSVGLLDAMRVAPDVFHPEAPGARLTDGREDAPLRAAPGVTARAWQHGRWWVNDPDCLVLRPSFGARRRWSAVVERHGGLRTFSDRVAELDGWGLDTVRRLLGPPADPVPC